jgi:hypothetical protein
MSSFSRAVIDALLPKGSLWNVKQGGDLDLLLEAMGENDDRVVDDICCLSDIRDPQKTPFLSDLEKEYGVPTDTRLSEQDRRNQLEAIIYHGEHNASKDDLQRALNDAGFGVQVHENSPAVDPDIFLNSVPLMVADGDNAYAGYFPVTPGVYTSVAGKTGGDLLVNGAIFKQRPNYLSVANGDNMFAGNSGAFAGSYTELRQDEIIYPIPDDPAAWPYFFFVGGDATRDGEGKLTGIEVVDIPIERKTAFERIILKYKPVHTWAGLIVNYT